jgi:hypothetical protein
VIVPPIPISLVPLSIRRAEVFNMFVENTVEKEQCAGVSDSSRDASTHCTGQSAGTFVVGLASRIGTSSQFLVLSSQPELGRRKTISQKLRTDY